MKKTCTLDTTCVQVMCAWCVCTCTGMLHVHHRQLCLTLSTPLGPVNYIHLYRRFIFSFQIYLFHELVPRVHYPAVRVHVIKFSSGAFICSTMCNIILHVLICTQLLLPGLV